jgi:hypothetical protein
MVTVAVASCQQVIYCLRGGSLLCLCGSQRSLGPA